MKIFVDEIKCDYRCPFYYDQMKCPYDYNRACFNHHKKDIKECNCFKKLDIENINPDGGNIAQLLKFMKRITPIQYPKVSPNEISQDVPIEEGLGYWHYMVDRRAHGEVSFTDWNPGLIDVGSVCWLMWDVYEIDYSGGKYQFLCMKVQEWFWGIFGPFDYYQYIVPVGYDRFSDINNINPDDVWEYIEGCKNWNRTGKYKPIDYSPRFEFVMPDGYSYSYEIGDNDYTWMQPT